MKKIVLITATLSAFILLNTANVYAKRLLPHLKKSVSATTNKSAAPVSGRVTTAVSFRGDRKAININFNNMGVATRIDYTLSYNTRGTTQGVTGTIIPSGENSISRELLLGTCSRNVCRYDTGITNARATITSTLANGKRVVKRYRLKV